VQSGRDSDSPRRILSHPKCDDVRTPTSGRRHQAISSLPTVVEERPFRAASNPHPRWALAPPLNRSFTPSSEPRKSRNRATPGESPRLTTLAFPATLEKP
jgi:hypothetical protein